MSRPSIEQVADAARRQVEQWIQGRSDLGDNPTKDLCMVASSYLWEMLREVGYEPELLSGGVRCDRPDPDASDFIQAVATG